MGWQEAVFLALRIVLGLITLFSGIFAIAEILFSKVVADLPMEEEPIILFIAGLSFSILFHILHLILKRKF